MNMCSCFRPWC